MDRISRVGIVDGVRAKRKGEEVVYLMATIRFETELVNELSYSSDKNRIDTVDIAFPVNAGVNPGDVVTMDIVTQTMIDRFMPALEAGTTEDEPETEVVDLPHGYQLSDKAPADWNDYSVDVDDQDPDDASTIDLVGGDEDDANEGVVIYRYTNGNIDDQYCNIGDCLLWASQVINKVPYCRLHPTPIEDAGDSDEDA